MTGQVIYKYELRPGAARVEMPHGAQLLHIDSQGSGAFLWALVSPDEETVTRKVLVVPTGFFFTVAETMHFIGTFQIREPGEPLLVFHAFDCGEFE